MYSLCSKLDNIAVPYSSVVFLAASWKCNHNKFDNSFHRDFVVFRFSLIERYVCAIFVVKEDKDKKSIVHQT